MPPGSLLGLLSPSSVVVGRDSPAARPRSEPVLLAVIGDRRGVIAAALVGIGRGDLVDRIGFHGQGPISA